MSATLAVDERSSVREILSVVVLYDDRASRDHVLRIRDHLVDHFGGELELVCSWWKFDFLAEPNFAKAAAKEVEEADVVLFALHSSLALPAYVEAWVERAIAKGRSGNGLLALLAGEDNEGELVEVDRFLTGAAVRAGLDYLGASATAAVPSELARRSIAQRAYTRTSVMDDILNNRPSARPRWGLNE